MKTKLKISILMMICICAVLLSGCKQFTTIAGRAPSKNKVLLAVKKECPTEQIELVSQTRTRTLPMEVTYHFRSTERDLEFDAVSSVSNLSFFREGDTPIYCKEIEVGYADAVIDLYHDDTFYAMLGEIGGTSIFFHDPSDFEQMARDLVMVSDIYAPEKEYNTEYWMKKHPIHHTIAAMWVSDPENLKQSEKVKIADIEINGCITYEEVLETLQEAYERNVSLGNIPR